MRKRRSKVKNTKRLGIYVVFLSLIVLPIAFLMWWSGSLEPLSETGQEQIFEVKQGMTAAQVADELEKNNIIQSAQAFRQLSKLNKADSKLMAGQYLVSSAMSARDVLDILLKGPEPDIIKVTIPEGYTLAQIVETLEKNTLGTEQELYKAMESFTSKDYSFLQDVPTGKDRLEGFVFPDTYFFDKESQPKEVINRFLERFEQELTAETRSRLQELNLSVYDWVIKASIVEREAVKAEERPLIAGVFDNRLRTGMALQSCATVQYILGEVKPVLSIADTEIDSPYNTYKYAGLPPGPISNPGHASLEAVLYPEKTDYFYFVAKSDGSHAFAVTYNQHLQNINKYQ